VPLFSSVSWAAEMPSTVMLPIATLRPVLPTPMPMLSTAVICELASPPATTAAWVTVVVARLPTADALPVSIAPCASPPAPPGPPAAIAVFAPDCPLDTPRLMTNATWRMSTAP
jgi:hypothetical protein